MASITAAIVNEVGGNFSLESVELDDPRDDELLVRVEACGVCHTDVEVQGALTPLPAVLGHEGTGIVEAVGRGVQSVKPGDRVVMSYPSCGHCSSCSEGQPFVCDDIVNLCFDGHRADGSRTIKHNGVPISSAFFQQSAFASHAITTERNIVPVKKEAESSLLASLPCGVQTGAGAVLNSFQAKAGDSLAVFGAGAVGLSAVMMARVLGIAPLIAVDINPERLNLALELGATHAINAKDGDVADRIREYAPKGVNFSFETSGNEQALNDAIACLKVAGQCGLATVPHMGQKYMFSPSEVFLRIASMRGIAQGSSIPKTFLPKLLELQRRGEFPVERLIKTYDFADINQAFHDAHQGTTIKPVLMMS